MSTHRFAAMALIALAITAHPCPPGLAAGATTDADDARVRRFKAIQQRRLMEGVRARLARYQARTRPSADPTAAGTRRRRPRDVAEPGGPQSVAGARLGTGSSQATPSAYPNVIMNNRAGDTATCPSAPCTGLPWSGQSEVSIAAHGSNG